MVKSKKRGAPPEMCIRDRKYAELAKKGEPCSNWFGQKPDLLLMDGGRGQVSAAKDAPVSYTHLDVYKRQVRVHRPAGPDHHRVRTPADQNVKAHPLHRRSERELKPVKGAPYNGI